MTPKHTPGPWTVSGVNFAYTGPGIEGADGMYVAVACGEPGEEGANARLIAAAPELLAVLCEIADRADEQDLLAVMRLVPKARAAIAKAEGKP